MSGITQPAQPAHPARPAQTAQRHDFTGKVAIVTGAAQGIGEAYARALRHGGTAARGAQQRERHPDT